MKKVFERKQTWNFFSKRNKVRIEIVALNIDACAINIILRFTPGLQVLRHLKGKDSFLRKPNLRFNTVNLNKIQIMFTFVKKK